MSRLAVVCLVVFGACASTERAGEAPHGATLEVANRASVDVSIDVRGRVELTVHAGTRARVHDLLPGTAPVVARATTGGAGVFERRDTVTLADGKSTTWVVLPDAAGGEPLPDPPALATLIVTNTTTEHVRVSLDGAVLGRVFAGETRRFDDLTSGPHALVALPDDDSAQARAALELVPGGETTWTVANVGGTVHIENRTSESLTVSVDGAERTHITPGATWDGMVALGTHVLSGVSEPSQKPYESTLTVLADQPVVWIVTAGQAELVVDNRSGEAITVAVAGQSIPVARGASVIVSDIPTGPVAIDAVGSSGMTYAGRIDLAPGQRAHWAAERVLGSVRVVNRTGRKLWIYTKPKGGSEDEAGELGSDTPVLLRNLARAPIGLSAIDPIGKRRYTTEIDLSEVPAGTWTIMPATGSLAIENERDELVTVFANALRVGDVPPNATQVFPGIGVGDALVESLGGRTGYVQHSRTSITEDRVALVVLPDPTAFVLVENATGEPLATRGVLADQVARLAEGSVTRFRMRAGKLRLTAVGNDSGLVYQTDVNATSDAPARWVVRQTPASLMVWNRMNEALAITVDDRAVGSIGPDENLTVDGLAPGKRTVQAVGLASGTLHSEVVNLAPAGEEHMSFTMKLAAIVIENRASEVVGVTIDGEPWGEVAANATHGFANLRTGKHKVEFDYRSSHRVSETDIEAREGQRVLVVAEVPMALVVVQNGSRQAARVLVDGQPIATVAADAPPTLVHVPAGPRLVQFERLGDHTVVSFRLDFWADSAIHLPVPPPDARLVVVNREQHATEIRFGELVVGTVDADSSMIFDALPDDTNTLTARSPDGTVTHSELRHFQPGETSTWVLEPSPVRP